MGAQPIRAGSGEALAAGNAQAPWPRFAELRTPPMTDRPIPFVAPMIRANIDSQEARA